MTKSTTDYAAEIRATLKGKGITSRQVSVKSDYYSMGSAIRITVKDPAVSLAMVNAIAEPAERSDRDGYGEILSGGNRFVTAQYSMEAHAALGVPYVAAVQAATEELAIAPESRLIPVAGTPFYVGRNRQNGALNLWGEDGHICQYSTVESIACGVGALMVDRQAQTAGRDVENNR